MHPVLLSLAINLSCRYVKKITVIHRRTVHGIRGRNEMAGKYRLLPAGPLNRVFVFLFEMDFRNQPGQLVHLAGIILVIEELRMGFQK